MADKIKIRRGLFADLPILDEGEFGLVTDRRTVYIGTESDGNLLVNPILLSPDGYTIDGYLYPAVDNVHGLGTPDKRWQSISVGPGSIHITSKETDPGHTENNEFTIGINPASNKLQIASGDSVLIELDPVAGAVFPSGGSAPGGVSAITEQEHFNQLSEAIDHLRVAADAYGAGGTEAEHYAQQAQINQSIVQALDGYVISSAAISSIIPAIDNTIDLGSLSFTFSNGNFKGDLWSRNGLGTLRNWSAWEANGSQGMILSSAGGSTSIFPITNRLGITGHVALPNDYDILFSSTITANDAADVGITRNGFNNISITDGADGYGGLRIADGSLTNPSLSFGLGTGVGLYRPSASTLGFAANGSTSNMVLGGRLQVTINGTLILQLTEANFASWSGATTMNWDGRSQISSPSDGNIKLSDNASTSFGLLQFGGITSEYPALKRSGHALLARTAADDGYSYFYGPLIVPTTERIKWDSRLQISSPSDTDIKFHNSSETIDGTIRLSSFQFQFYRTGGSVLADLQANGISSSYVAGAGYRLDDFGSGANYLKGLTLTSDSSVAWISNTVFLSGQVDVGLKRLGSSTLQVTDGNINYGSLAVETLDAYVGSTQAISIDPTSGLLLGSDKLITWESTSDISTGTPDVGFARAAAGVAKLTDGSSGAGSLQFGTRSIVSSPADGELLLTNAAGNDFTYLRLGGSTSAYPRIDRLGAGIRVYQGDGQAVSLVMCYEFTDQNNSGSLISGYLEFAGEVGNGRAILWSNNSLHSGTKDIGLERGGQNILKVTAGVGGYGSVALQSLDAYHGEVQSISLHSVSGLTFGSDKSIIWDNNTDISLGTPDVGIKRKGLSAIQITDGSTGYGNLNVGRIIFQDEIDLGQLLDGYASSAGGISENTFQENKNAQEQINQSILQSLDGYAVVPDTAAIGDGYLAFFIDGGRQLAGDNDLYWGRTNNRLGIGSPPTAKLSVTANSSDLPALFVTHVGNSGSSGSFAFAAPDLTGISYVTVFRLDDFGFKLATGSQFRGMDFQVGTLGSASRLSIHPLGHIGIGTISPIEALTVNGVTALRELDITEVPIAEDGYGKIYVKDDNKLYYKDGLGSEFDLTGGIVASEGSDGYVAFFTGSSSIAGDNDLFYDRVNDRLGLGTSLPAAKLHVAGDGYFDGSLNPLTDDTWTLGTQNNRWESLWLGPNSLHIRSNASETSGAVERTWDIGNDGDGDFSITQDAITHVQIRHIDNTLDSYCGIGANVFPTATLQVGGDLCLGIGAQYSYPVSVILFNKTINTIPIGSIVVADTPFVAGPTTLLACKTTTGSGDRAAIGVAYEDILPSSTGRVAVAGAVRVLVTGGVTAGDGVETSTTAGRAQSNTTNSSSRIGVFMETIAGTGMAWMILR